jgi:hypothetical protein
MTDVIQLLAGLRDKGIVLTLRDDAIICRALPGAVTDDIRQIISGTRTEICFYLRAVAAAVRPPIKQTSNREPSLVQEVWWKCAQGGSLEIPMGRIPMVTHVKGDTSAVTAALRHILLQNEVLRTSFRSSNGRLEVLTHPTEDFDAEIEVGVDGHVSGCALHELITEFIARPLPIDADRLLRAKIVVTGADTATVIVVAHHIIIDHVSALMIEAQLRGLIRTGTRKVEQPIIQFRDYAAMDRAWFNGPGGTIVTEYWRRWSADKVPVKEPLTGLPLKWTSCVTTTSEFELPATVVNTVRAILTRRFGVSPFYVYLGAIALAIHRWSGAEQFVIACVSDMRASAELSSIVGLFFSFDLISVNVSASMDFTTLVRRLVVAHQSASILRIPQVPLPSDDDPDCPHTSFIQKASATVNFIPSTLDFEAGTMSSDVQTAAYSLRRPQYMKVESDRPTINRVPISMLLLDAVKAIRGQLQVGASQISDRSRGYLLRGFLEALNEVAGST